MTKKIFLIIAIAFLAVTSVSSQDIDFTYKTNSHINHNKIDFVDLNNDDFLDVVGIANDENIYINYSNLDGTFETQENIFSVSVGGELSDIAIANVDGDCKKEILVCDKINEKLYIIKGSEFSELEIVKIIDIKENSYYFKVADLNNDDYMDLIVFSYTSPSVLTVFLNQASNPGEFTELTSEEINYGFITDVNQDGNLDLLQNEGCWALGNGNGTFSTTYYDASYYDSNTGALSDVGDLNGDGFPDLLKYRDSGDAVIILQNNNGTSFTSVINSWIGENMNQTGGAIGDFNLDGKNDFVTTSWWSKIMRFSKQENSYFAFTYNALELSHNDGAQWGIQWKIIDLDNNGAPDVVYKGNELSVYINNIDGTFVEDTCTNQTTNIDKSEIENRICLLPNPAKNQLTISNGEFAINEIQIIDIAGTIVKELKTQYSKIKIQISDLPKGIYIVKVGNRVQKLIKE